MKWEDVDIIISVLDALKDAEYHTITGTTLKVAKYFHFTPKQMNEKETENLIKKIIKNNNLESIKDMGKLMNELKSHHAGSVDMALAGKLAKSNFLK